MVIKFVGTDERINAVDGQPENIIPSPIVSVAKSL